MFTTARLHFWRLLKSEACQLLTGNISTYITGEFDYIFYCTLSVWPSPIWAAHFFQEQITSSPLHSQPIANASQICAFQHGFKTVVSSLMHLKPSKVGLQCFIHSNSSPNSDWVQFAAGPSLQDLVISSWAAGFLCSLLVSGYCYFYHLGFDSRQSIKSTKYPQL